MKMKKNILLILLATIVSVVLLLSYGKDENPTKPDDNKKENVLTSANIGLKGGTIKTDNIEIEIPTGAFQENSELKILESYETTPLYEVYDQSASSPTLIIDNETGIGRLSFDPKFHFQNDNYRKWKILPWFNYKQEWYANDSDGNEKVVGSSTGKELFATI